MAPGATHGIWKSATNFFSQGQNERWRGLITEKQSLRYEEVAKERLTPELAAVRCANGLTAGTPLPINGDK